MLVVVEIRPAFYLPSCEHPLVLLSANDTQHSWLSGAADSKVTG